MASKKLTTNDLHIRIKKADTISKINSAIKLNKDKNINDIINLALEYGLDILLDESNVSKDTINDSLEKNTRKLINKINRFQKQQTKDNIKLQILLSTQEAILSYLMNEKDFELKASDFTISNELKEDFFNNTPALAVDLKQRLIEDLLLDNDDE